MIRVTVRATLIYPSPNTALYQKSKPSKKIKIEDSGGYGETGKLKVRISVGSGLGFHRQKMNLDPYVFLQGSLWPLLSLQILILIQTRLVLTKVDGLFEIES